MALKAHLEPFSNTQETSLDARRYARRALRLHTSGVSENGDPANVTIHNLSAAGLLIETDLDLMPGDRLAIGLPEVGPVAAEIVWSSERLYGCAFEQALGEAALAASELAAKPAQIGENVEARAEAPEAPLGLKSRDSSFGSRLNRLRREKGLTLDQVASALSVSKPTVWAWEKGKAKPIPERIEGIAQVLGVSTRELTENGPQGNRENLLAQCRVRIASEFKIHPENVRIMIEV